jgi:F0F1-type ATP synthase assembly protein I
MPDRKEPGWVAYATYGFEVAAGVGLGVVVGMWLDRRYHWTPWGMVIGAAVGIIAGMYAMIRDALRANRD